MKFSPEQTENPFSGLLLAIFNTLECAKCIFCHCSSFQIHFSSAAASGFNGSSIVSPTPLYAIYRVSSYKNALEFSLVLKMSLFTWILRRVSRSPVISVRLAVSMITTWK